MRKKVMGLLLALSLVLSLAACGKEAASAPEAGTEGQEPVQTQTAETAFQPEKKLSQLVAERNPKDREEEVTIALELAREELDRAVAAAEAAGLSGDETLQERLGFWDGRITDLVEYLPEYMEQVDGEPTQEQDEELFDIILDAAWVYNAARGIARDPALWLERYKLIYNSQTGTSDSGAAPENIETGGVWPQGYFFSDRMPAMEQVDELLSMPTGEEYGFENGEEYLLYVYSLEPDGMEAYLDQLVQAGFREELKDGWSEGFMWFGRLDDSEGHISLAMTYNGQAEGTAKRPCLTVQIYNYDIVGMLIDLGQITVY